jgi:hypothetical protein
MPAIVVTLAAIVFPLAAGTLLAVLVLPTGDDRLRSVIIPAGWVLSLLVGAAFYKLDQKQGNLFTLRTVIRGCTLALLLLLPSLALTVATFYGNGVPQQTLYIDPRERAPFAWEGLGYALYLLAYTGWLLAMFIVAPALLALGVALAAGWRTVPPREKLLGVLALGAVAMLLAASWGDWSAIGAWLAD